MDEFFTVDNISKTLGVTYRTVVRWITAKRLKAYQPTGKKGKVFVKKQDFMTCIECRTR